MEMQSSDVTGSSLSTGDDIGQITWPRVAAEPGRIFGELDGAGPYALPPVAGPNPSEFHGVYESCVDGLSREMRIAPDGSGVATVDIALCLPGNERYAWEKRSVHLVARVRDSWLGEVTRGAANRTERGERIVEATVALANVPGQHTVAVAEQGLTASDVAAMLRA